MYFQDQLESHNSKGHKQSGSAVRTGSSLKSGSASKPARRLRGRSSHARPVLKIETSDEIAFSSQHDEDETFEEPRKAIQPLQSARSKLQSADKKDRVRPFPEDKHKDLKAKKIGQTPKPRKLLKGLSLFK